MICTPCISRSIKSIAFIIFLTSFYRCDTLGQNILGFVIPGDSQDRMIGGNVFSTSAREKNFLLHRNTTIFPSADYEYCLDNLYREEHTDGLINQGQNSSHNLDITIPWESERFSSLLHLSFYSSNFFTGVMQNSLEGGNYSSHTDRMMLLYNIRISNFLTIAGNFTQLSDGKHSFINGYGALTFQPINNTFISLTSGNTGSLNILQLNITGINGVLPLHLQKRGFTLSGNTKLDRFRLSIQYDHGSLTSIPQATEVEDTRFLPHGVVDETKMNLRIELSEDFESIIGTGSQRISGNADFLSGESSYGKIPSVMLHDEEFHGGFQLRLKNNNFIVGDFQWRKLNGQIEGHIDTWPFVSIFQSFISTRKYFTAKGTLEYSKVHIGGNIPLSEKYSVGIGCNYLHILPSLRLESWQPKYIIFGVRAYDERKLDIQSLDLAILSGGIKGEIGNIGGSYSISQFVPLSIDRIVGPESSAGTGVSQAQENSAGANRTTGGQFHQFTLSYKF